MNKKFELCLKCYVMQKLLLKKSPLKTCLDASHMNN